jgi:hypothetical protein
MVKIEIGSRKIDFPSCWEELTEEDFSRVGHVLLNPWSPQLQYTLIRLLTAKVEPSIWVNLDDDDLLALLPLTDFFQEPVQLKSMKLFRIGIRNYYLPDRSNLLTADWCFSEQLLKAFLKTGEEKYLNQLVASVCRPKKLWIQFFPWLKKINLKWNGDLREKFHSGIMMERIEKIAQVPMYKRLMVVWWVVQIRWEVQKQNKALFTGSGEGGSGDWIEAAMDISEKQIFGNFDSTMQTPFSLILKYLNHINKKSK